MTNTATLAAATHPGTRVTVKITSADDRTEHDVLVDAAAAGALGRPRVTALCGSRIRPASLLQTPVEPCGRCSILLNTADQTGYAAR